MYTITDYGAVGDGKTLNTAAIQRALDECGKTGGTVLVPPGIWLTGSLFLRSNTELHLEKGAVLLGSPDLADYNELDAYEQNWQSTAEGWSGKHLILAIEVENVALTGEGCIDGNGRAFFSTTPRFTGLICWKDGGCNAKDYEHCGRPGQEIVFIESRNIRIRDVQLRDMTCWSCFLYGCENIQISGLKVDNGIRNLNTDGIDIDSCRNVTVSNCIIRTGDDAIAVRGAPSHLKDNSRICENVTIQNCLFWVSADGMRIGVGNGTIQNVLISNIVIEHAGRGLHLQNCYGQVSTGVNISDVIFSNIIIRQTTSPIMVAAGTENSLAYLKNISFRDINISSPGSVIVAGAGRTRIENVSFSDVFFQLEDPDGDLEDREGGGLHTENAVFRAEFAHDIRLTNFRFSGKTARKAVSVHEVTGLQGEPVKAD